MTDLYWIGIIKSHMTYIRRYEYAAMLRDIERNLYTKYSDGKKLESGYPIPLEDKSLGQESFLFNVIEDVTKILETPRYNLKRSEFRNMIEDLILLAREEKLGIIFS